MGVTFAPSLTSSSILGITLAIVQNEPVNANPILQLQKSNCYTPISSNRLSIVSVIMIPAVIGATLPGSVVIR